MEIKRTAFGQLETGEEVSLFTLNNDNSMEIALTNYGAAIVSLFAPGKNGNVDDLVLGFDSVDGYRSEAYMKSSPYFGCTVGRFANRMKSGKFSLNGIEHSISRNEEPNSLHGGKVGFDKNLWNVEGEGFSSDSEVGIEMSLVSPDGDQGYPGDLSVTVRFTLNNKNELSIEYSAVSNKDTVVNLTNHSYFNLAGHGSGSIKEHELMIPSEKYLQLDTELIPTGEIAGVKNTSLDYSKLAPIGEVMKLDGNDKITGGYAHTYILDEDASGLSLAAKLIDSSSGRIMEIFTSEPGILLYTGDGLDGTLIGKGDQEYEKWAGLCLEPQKMPDAPNHENFPAAGLAAGETYKSKSVYRFSVV
jgi:aldose 1-epimerase